VHPSAGSSLVMTLPRTPVYAGKHFLPILKRQLKELRPRREAALNHNSESTKVDSHILMMGSNGLILQNRTFVSKIGHSRRPIYTKRARAAMVFSFEFPGETPLMAETDIHRRLFDQLAFPNECQRLLQTDSTDPDLRRTPEFKINVTPQLPFGHATVVGQTVHPEASFR